MKMYSEQYITQLKELHARRDRPRGFGGKIKPLGLFHSYIEKWQPKTALDYGCGKGTILEHNKKQYLILNGTVTTQQLQNIIL